jgi:hypothetical protein
MSYISTGPNIKTDRISNVEIDGRNTRRVDVVSRDDGRIGEVRRHVAAVLCKCIRQYIVVEIG